MQQDKTSFRNKNRKAASVQYMQNKTRVLNMEFHNKYIKMMQCRTYSNKEKSINIVVLSAKLTGC